MQVAGLQVVVDQGAIDRAVPLLPGTRMTLPLMLHSPQVCCTHTATFIPPWLSQASRGPFAFAYNFQPVYLLQTDSKPHDQLFPLCMILSSAHHSPPNCILKAPKKLSVTAGALHGACTSKGQGSAIVQ